MAMLIGANEQYHVWGRGTGKTSGLLAPNSKRNMELMPRSVGLTVSSTYAQALTQTLPSRIAGWEKLGWIKDVHYVIGRRGPRSWKEPYEPVIDYKNVIHCYNGSILQMVSQDVKGSMVGRNSDWIDGDEAKFLDYKRFGEEIMPTLRANKHRFGHLPFHWSITLTTSMPTEAEAKWILEKEKMMDKGVLELILGLVAKQLELKSQLHPDLAKYKREPLEKEIALIEAELNLERKNFIHFSEASSLDNIHVLDMEYIRKMRRDLPDFIFNTEFLNIRPDSVESGFYPLFDPQLHCYGHTYEYEEVDYNPETLQKSPAKLDRDCNAMLPLRMAVDWGAKISCISIGQYDNNQYKLINNFYVKHPELTDALAKKFIEYYANHLHKEVVFIKDRRWGDDRRPDSPTTLNEHFINILKDHGWTVTVVSTQLRVNHGDLYHHWHRIMGQREAHLPVFSFNKYNCKELITSVMLTPAKETDKGIQKDKKSERNNSIHQEDATHFSDTLDLHLLSIGSVLKATQQAFVAPFVV